MKHSGAREVASPPVGRIDRLALYSLTARVLLVVTVLGMFSMLAGWF